MILVHGSAGGLDSWDPVLPMITPAFEAWVYARRGYPPSGSAASPKLFAHDVADLSAVIAAAGGSAHVIGASYGASVVLHALLDGPAGIRSAVLFEPPLYAAGSALEPVLAEYSHLIEVGDAPGAARHFAEKVARVPIPLLDALGPQEPDPDELMGCLHDLEAMVADAAGLDQWRGIRIPFLLLSGEDTWEPMPATMQALAAAVPNAEHVRLAGQSHFATHTAPQQFADAVISYLVDPR